MNLSEISAIAKELEHELVDRKFGRLFTLSRLQLAVDFRLHGSKYLFVSVEPTSPRVYLITRRVRDLEKQSVNAGAFAVYVQKRLAGMKLESIEQIDGERVLVFKFAGVDEIGEHRSFSLAAQLTGRSANLFLLDEKRQILESLRETRGEGQIAGDVYSPPQRAKRERSADKAVERAAGETLSQLLDERYLAAEHEARVATLANAARGKLRRQITKLERLAGKLDTDLAGHGDAEKWKRLGDLLLANVGTARRSGPSYTVVDYYDDATPEVEIEADDNMSVTEAAESYFKRYAKARNAAGEIAKRRKEMEAELAKLRSSAERLEDAVALGDQALIEEFAANKKTEVAQKTRAGGETSSIARGFVSSDGFEILVGKKARDNDQLSFRVAKSLDLWMHAADYPGSHVVVRNPNRLDIPPTTLLEAAQLAAFYSQGRTQVKAAVHYTQKKFVNKPRGAAPGLVSLASFKTILVEPRVPDLARSDK